MNCPYPHCGGEIKAVSGLAYCAKCSQTAIECPLCSIWNQSLARFCRNCGKEVDFPTTHASFGITALYRQINPVFLGLLTSGTNNGGGKADSIDVAPYGGALWAMNSDGVIYQIFTKAVTPTVWHKLPGKKFLFPFVLEQTGEKEPVIYAANEERVYKLEIVTKRYEPLLYEADASKQVICSGVLKVKGNLYFLIRRSDELYLRCIGQAEWEQALGPVELHESNQPSICEVNGSLWVITKSNLFVFPGFDKSSPINQSWKPLRFWPTKRGVWYSQRLNHDKSEKHLLSRITFERNGIVQYEAEDVPHTARFAVNQSSGQIAIFLKESIKVKGFNGYLLGKTAENVDNENPEAIYLSSDHASLFWYEARNSQVYQWNFDKAVPMPLWTSKEGLNFSRFYLSYGCLWGLSGGAVWRWDLVDA
jgi:hypothetical protein